MYDVASTEEEKLEQSAIISLRGHERDHEEATGCLRRRETAPTPKLRTPLSKSLNR